MGVLIFTVHVIRIIPVYPKGRVPRFCGMRWAEGSTRTCLLIPLLGLASLALEKNYSTFMDNIYRQNFGTVIDTKFASAYS